MLVKTYPIIDSTSKEHLKVQHLLDLAPFSKHDILNLFDIASTFIDQDKLIPAIPILKGKIVTNLFFEPSTRTRSAFEIAANKLGAHVLNITAETSAIQKGESLLDTINNIAAMQTDFLVLRHPQASAAKLLSTYVKQQIHIINAGDGRHAHPSQGLLDAFTVYRTLGRLENLNIAIIGDILHSRVVRSQIEVFNKFQNNHIRLIGPKSLLPDYFNIPNTEKYYNLETGLQDADVIITLRLQQERMSQAFIPSLVEYHHLYGLTQATLRHANPKAIVLHPGPMNREVEITSEVADSTRAMILKQVTFGVAIRMAIFKWLTYV